jgi:hypothetical protein
MLRMQAVATRASTGRWWRGAPLCEANGPRLDQVSTKLVDPLGFQSGSTALFSYIVAHGYWGFSKKRVTCSRHMKLFSWQAHKTCLGTVKVNGGITSGVPCAKSLEPDSPIPCYIIDGSTSTGWRPPRCLGNLHIQALPQAIHTRPKARGHFRQGRSSQSPDLHYFFFSTP